MIGGRRLGILSRVRHQMEQSDMCRRFDGRDLSRSLLFWRRCLIDFAASIPRH
jgi:hypothetical protein